MANKELKWELDRGVEINRRYLQKMLNWNGLLEQQKQKLTEFDRDCAIAGIRVTSRASYINYLKDFALFVQKPFDEVTKEDVKSYFCSLIDQKLSEHTRKNRTIAIKKLYQYLAGMKKGEYPEVVSWLQPRMKYNFKLPEDIPSIGDVKAIIDKGCTELSHKALISVLAEGALRATEIISINVGDVTFDNIGVTICVRRSKTQIREISCFNAAPCLKLWVNNHPFKNSPEAPLFICLSKRNFGNRLSVDGLRTLVKSLCKKAGITKRVYTHLFRHFGITEASKYMTEPQLEQFAGFSKGSKMPSVYCHQTFEDTRRAMMEHLNILPEDELQNPLQTIKCQHCDTVNDCTATFCNKCSHPLKKQEALKLHTANSLRERILEQIFSDSIIQNRVLQLVQSDAGMEKMVKSLTKVVPVQPE